jgi:hypothetical protein
MPLRRKICRWIGATVRGLQRKPSAPTLDRIFLHIGVEKTGTTTLQVTTALNRRLLKQHGYFFSTTLEGSVCNHIGLALCAAKPAAAADLRQYAGLTGDEAYGAFLQSYPQQIARELLGSGCHTAILSNEHCSSRLDTVAEIAKVHQIIAPIARECRAIVYLRRQDELVASHYSNSVRSGATHEFYFPQEMPWLDYLKLLEMWAKVFGKENLDIRIFEPQQLKDGDLLADFFSTVGFTRYDELFRPEDQNRSLDIYTLEFLRRFNTHLPIYTNGDASRDRRAIDEALTAIATRECLRPSAASATAFLNQFTGSNTEVARRYLNRKDGMLFTNAPSLDQPARLPTLDVGQVVAISVALWRWQDDRLRAAVSKDRDGPRRNPRSPLIPPIFRSRRGRLSMSDG